jgi:long-chain acyl-CoA synthetase
MSALDTLPRLLRRNAAERGAAVAMRLRHHGIWRAETWAEHQDGVLDLARGLAAVGFQRGDRLAVVGDNRPALYRAQLAAMALGGAAVPCWPDAEPEALAHVIADSGVSVVVAEDEDQVGKLLTVTDRMPPLKAIIFADPRMVHHEDVAIVRSLEDVVAAGRGGGADPRAAIDQGGTNDIALILYVTGASGPARAVALTHANLIAAATALSQAETVTASDEYVCYLPMAWIGEALYGLALPLLIGFTRSCPEDPETARRDLREIGPTIALLPPRICETMITDVTGRGTHAVGLKKRLNAAYLPDPVSGATRADRGFLAELLVHAPLRDQLGLNRLRWAHTGGLPADPQILRFMRGIGVNLKHGYGPAECAGLVSLSDDPTSLGAPLGGIETRAEADGTLRFTGANVAGGDFASGLLGAVGAGGLTLNGPKADQGRLGTGAELPVTRVEIALRASYYIADVVVLGDGQANVVALIAVEPDSLGLWAQDRGIAFAGIADLVAMPEVETLLSGEISRLSAEFAESIRPKRWLALAERPGGANAEAGLSMALRRRLALADQPLVAALFANPPGGQVRVIDAAGQRARETA